MNRIAIIGAGKTGRGFIARLAAESGYNVDFVDKDASLVERLNAAGQFEIAYFGDVREKTVINGYAAYTWENADLSGAELIFVAVGGQNLADVGGMLGQKLPADAKCCVIACENASSPAGKLTKAMGRADVPVSEATVFCTTIEDGALDIASENYPYLQCDAARLMGRVPCVAAVKPVDNFGDFLTRKLYTYNAASCVISYLGALRGHSVYADAANDPVVLELLDYNYRQINAAMCAEFGYSPEDQDEFAMLSRVKFTSRAIKDTVERNARDVARKLAPGERIIGIMELISKHGADPAVMEMTAAAAILYADDAKWQAYKAEHTYDEIIRRFCNVGDDAQSARILEYTARLAGGNFNPMKTEG